MRIEVDTDVVVGVADVVRRAAERVRGVALPRSPECEDLAAADAMTALRGVVAEGLDVLVGDLRLVALLVDVAAVDYARVENRGVVSR